jgi:serine/threonine protein kinase
LKTENVLLDQHGHAKICDFGLAQVNVSGYTDGCSAICGTLEYLVRLLIDSIDSLDEVSGGY